MKNSKKRILLSIIATILMITVLFVGKVNATTYSIYSVEKMKNNGTIGQTMWLDGGDLRKRNDVYCFEHKTAFLGGEYRISDIVEISGKTATSKGTGKSNTRNENATMNYILTEGNYSKWMFTDGGVGMSVRNIAIWGYQNKWLNSLPNGFFLKNWKHKYSRYNMDDYDFGNQGRSKIEDAKKLVKEAENYAKGNIGKAEAEIVGASTVKEYVKNQYGPFKIKYKGDKISISVFDLNGKAVADRYIKVYSDKDCKKEISKANIKSSTNFYVRITNGAKIKSLKCKVTSNLISAKIFFLGRSDFWNGVGQGIIFVKPGKTPTEKTVEFDIRLLQKVSIKGYVWIDVQRTKQHDWDSLYNGDEARVEGVTVNLVNKASKKVIATVKTNSNGEYIFDKPFYEDELKNHYVEFNYKGVKVGNKDISKFIPVAFNSVDVNAINKAGSRAIMDSVAEKDANLSGIASTHKGTEENKEIIYGLMYDGNLYNKLIEDEVLNNINLGLKKIPETEYVISENIANVKIGIKGYEYTYIYGGNGDRSRVAAPKVNWQNKYDINAYSRDIYPSDIVYKDKDSTKELTVDVTYRIDITNTTNYNIEELYKEQKLYITNLANKFDTKRYELNDKNWTANNDTATITDNYRKNIYSNGISSNGTATSYITFKVKRDALIDILNHPDGIIENKPTQATAVGYHQYTRKDYSWQNNITKEQTHVTPNDTRSADAPYLIFKLGEERVLSGRVFEDTVITTDGQKLGNGVYNETENVVGDVKVELLDIRFDENNKEITDITQLPVSNIYPRDRINSDKVINNEQISIKAEVKTGKDGVFTLNGLVPGYYYLRFTYGDGTQKIFDLSGNEISTLAVKDYKSTIVTNDIAKQALKGGTNFEWYKQLNNVNASVALDNLNTRIAVNTGTPNSNIIAGTAKIHITIENTPEIDKTNIEVTENGQSALAANKFNGLNLGLIKIPVQKARLEKIITNIKLANAQANFGFGGNPETDSMQGVSDLDQTKNGGSKYVRAELADEYISGANLELTYGIKVTNISDVNYYNNDYYWYGEADSNKEVTLNVQELTDYLDQTLQFKPEVSDSRIVVGTDENITNKTILKVQNIGILYTENNKARETDKLKTSDTVPVIAERILSKQDDDMEFINEAKITNISNGTDTRDNAPEKETQIKVIKAIEDNYESKATATVTPPTGANRQEIILYTIAGIIALAVLSAGVVMIKKIVKK